MRRETWESGKRASDTHQFVYRLGVLLVAMATPLAAQTNVAAWNAVKALTTGTQVRVTVGSRTIRGEIERTTDDVLVVTSGKSQEMFDRQQVSVGEETEPSQEKHADRPCGRDGCGAWDWHRRPAKAWAVGGDNTRRNYGRTLGGGGNRRHPCRRDHPYQRLARSLQEIASPARKS